MSKSALEKRAHAVLSGLLTEVLKTASLRKRAGIRLPKKGKVYLSLDLEIVDAVTMKKFNRKFRGKNQPTDVLSFPAHSVFQKKGHLGDLMICLPVLISQAQAEKHSPSQELSILLTHGVLHLLHFDHEKGPKFAREMATWEKKLLKAPGLIARGGRRP